MNQEKNDEGELYEVHNLMIYKGTISDKLLEALDTHIIPPNSGFTLTQVGKIIRENIENEALREALERFFKEKLIPHGEFYLVPRPHLKECISLIDTDRNGLITLARLSGRPLVKIAEEFGITNERVRQITLNTLKMRLPKVMEDYYSDIFMHFQISRKEFFSIFPESDPMAYQYLMIRYGNSRKTKPLLGIGGIKDYDGSYLIELSAYIAKVL